MNGGCEPRLRGWAKRRRGCGRRKASCGGGASVDVDGGMTGWIRKTTTATKAGGRAVPVDSDGGVGGTFAEDQAEQELVPFSAWQDAGCAIETAIGTDPDAGTEWGCRVEAQVRVQREVAGEHMEARTRYLNANGDEVLLVALACNAARQALASLCNVPWKRKTQRYRWFLEHTLLCLSNRRTGGLRLPLSGLRDMVQ